MTIAIGKIVKSNTHIDYVCQVYNPGEMEPCPKPADYSFGTFVAIHLGDGAQRSNGQLVGVIYNTLLMNPDFGNLGPRLSPRQELEVFSPDYLAETATLVGIIALGWIDGEGASHQGVPALAATVNNRVTILDDDALHAFHRDGAGRVESALRAGVAEPEQPARAAAADHHGGTAGSIVPGAAGPAGADAQQFGVEEHCAAVGIEAWPGEGSMSDQCIGTVKGPGETPNEFTLVAPDPDRRLKHGEFLYYATEVDGEERSILGRVTGRESIRLLPDSFMADPNVPPQEVAALVGYQSDANELFEITVTVLGYHSERDGRVHQPACAACGRVACLHRQRRTVDAGVEQAADGDNRGQRPPGQSVEPRGGCSAGGAGCARLHQHPSGHHRQHGQRQELPGGRAAGGADDAAQPRRDADHRPARRVQHAAGDAESARRSGTATTSPRCAYFDRIRSACASTV